MRLRALAAALVLTSTPAAAEEASEVANFAFASRLGSGIYEVKGQVVQIYRIPASFGLLPRTSLRDWGLRLRIPVTLGFYDFELQDLPHEGLPEDVGTLGITPGVWFEVPVSARWMLWPFAEAGPIRDFTSDTTVWTYTLGLRSEVVIPRRLQWVARNELAWTGASGEGEALDDAFGELRTGGEVWGKTRIRLGGSALVVGGFAANFLYWKRARFLSPELQEHPYRVQWETGVLLRAGPALHVWKVKIPDVGVSYRYGDSPSSVRFILGSSF